MTDPPNPSSWAFESDLADPGLKVYSCLFLHLIAAWHIPSVDHYRAGKRKVGRCLVEVYSIDREVTRLSPAGFSKGFWLLKVAEPRRSSRAHFAKRHGN